MIKYFTGFIIYCISVVDDIADFIYCFYQPLIVFTLVLLVIGGIYFYDQNSEVGAWEYNNLHEICRQNEAVSKACQEALADNIISKREYDKIKDLKNKTIIETKKELILGH